MSLTHHTNLTLSDLAREERRERRQYRFLFALCLLLFLFIAAVSRLLPRSWRPLSSSAAGRESIIAEARRTTHAILPFAFINGV